ncbi:MAG: ribonuclease III [Candidatus Deferrimicrobiaceae bacterium]
MNALEKKIGYRFRARDLLEEALRHASTAEAGTRKSYQRLEYLGDAVLNLCIAEETYRTFPAAEEGALSKARSALINNRNLVRVGERIGVPDALRIDPSVRETGGGVTRKMVADAVEAIAGAIFLDGGYEEARRFVLAHFWAGKEVGALVAGFDAKSRLQEWCQKHRASLPRYRLLSAEGPHHSQTFRVSARLWDGREERGSGKTKKEAEMEAAERLLSLLEEEGEIR